MTKALAVLAVSALALTSCKKNANQSADQISQETLNQIAQHGFGTSNVQKMEDGYLVEGDILLTDEYLNSTPGGYYLRVGDVEQYRTTNLVSTGGGSRNITVSVSGSYTQALSDAVDGAIARYNGQNLQITFSRVASGGNINVKIVNGGPYIASSGFPSGGDPYGTVKFNKQYGGWQLNTLISVMAHEIGHCIGMRHTDYMDRSFSCGGAPSNEGASSVGAIFIPGTSVGPEAGSWMLACIGNGIDRPFTNNDKTALTYLY